MAGSGPDKAPRRTRVAKGCPSGRRRSGRDFPDLMVHMVEGVQPHNGAPTQSERIDGRVRE
jgi:hypothetical protein